MDRVSRGTAQAFTSACCGVPLADLLRRPVMNSRAPMPVPRNISDRGRLSEHIFQTVVSVQSANLARRPNSMGRTRWAIPRTSWVHEIAFFVHRGLSMPS